MSAAAIEESTLQAGLLLESVQAQQILAGETMQRLQAHVRGLDAVVRDQIRTTLIEEMQTMTGEIARVTQALRTLRRAADVRTSLWSCATVALCAIVVVGCGLRFIPSRTEIATLRAQRNELVENLQRLGAAGARIDLRHCGPARRLCIRVERQGSAYGDQGDYLVIKGY